MKPYQVLLIEDEEIVAGFIEHTFAGEDIQVTLMSNAESALEHLQHQPNQTDAILLDRNLPGMSGIEFLYQLKQDPALQRIPVIVETAEADPASIQQGIDAGAYYYLIKPLQRELLVAIVMEAASHYRDYCALQAALNETSQAMAMLQQAEFRMRTPDQARLLTNTLSQLFPEPGRVAGGLMQLLVNAVEHGNLGITYDEKTHLLMSRQWHNEVARRLKDPRYSHREVRVQFQRESDRMVLTIRDEGEGFHWQPYLEIQPERVFHLHGRGIAMARRISFDTLEYQGCGNQVQVSVRL